MGDYKSHYVDFVRVEECYKQGVPTPTSTRTPFGGFELRHCTHPQQHVNDNPALE